MKIALHKVILLALVLLCTSVSFAQKNRIEKANKEFDAYAYIDARAIYLSVVEDGYESAEIFKKLGDTYYWNSDYANAAKWYQKLINQYPGDAGADYYYRTAQSLKSINKYAESDKLMKFYEISGGDKYVIENFNNNQDYLESIDAMSKGYVVEKVEINTGYSDFGPTYYGDRLVYASSSKDTEGARLYEWTAQPFLDLFVAKMDENGILSDPESLSGDINTRFHESSATFTKDGNTVYFTRNNFTDGKKGKDQNKTMKLKLYRATKGGDTKSENGGDWGNIVELPFNSKEYSVAHPALSLDEKRLYFSSDMPGTLGMSDIWYVDILGDNTYSSPINLGPFFNTGARESFPYISQGNKLYFSTDGRSGLGGYDIYVTPLDETGNTGEIVNLGKPINSNLDDIGFIIDESKYIGFLSSNRDSDTGSLGDEIYRVRENCVITVTGIVYDLDTNDLLPGAEVSFLDENNALIDKITVGNDASYSFEADCEKQYTVRATKTNYLPNEVVLSTPDQTGIVKKDIPLKFDGPCPPNDLGCKLCLQPIFFDFDKWNIRPDAEVELAKILAAMRKYPEMRIHIESHTDSRATFAYNEGLSDRRAQATLNWLVDNGISRSRLSAKGYGEYQLLDRCIIFDECGKKIGTYDCSQEQLNNPKCSDGVDCSEAEHQLNRRSMFIIQN